MTHQSPCRIGVLFFGLILKLTCQNYGFQNVPVWHVNISGSPRGKLDVIFVCIHSYSLESRPPLFYLPSVLSLRLCTLLFPLPSPLPSLSPSGVSVGRVCVHYQPGSTARVCAAADGEIFQQVGWPGGGGGAEIGGEKEWLYGEKKGEGSRWC